MATATERTNEEWPRWPRDYHLKIDFNPPTPNFILVAE